MSVYHSEYTKRISFLGDFDNFFLERELEDTLGTPSVPPSRCLRLAPEDSICTKFHFLKTIRQTQYACVRIAYRHWD